MTFLKHLQRQKSTKMAQNRISNHQKSRTMNFSKKHVKFQNPSKKALNIAKREVNVV